MRIIKTKDYNDMSRKAANYIGALIINKPDCVLGLATGSTPIGTYKNLVAGYENGDYDFSNVRTWMSTRACPRRTSRAITTSCMTICFLM